MGNEKKKKKKKKEGRKKQRKDEEKKKKKKKKKNVGESVGRIKLNVKPVVVAGVEGNTGSA